MNWSWRIGQIGGIDVYMHWTFLLLLAFVGGVYLLVGVGWLAALLAVLFIMAIFGCVVLHEFGHAACARLFGIGTRDITLLPIGGLARLERIPEEPEQEFWIALAGPAVNVVIAGVLLALLYPLYGLTQLFSHPFSPQTPFFVRLMWMNVILVAFNMLPAFPMDGGRVLRSLLAMTMDYVRATNIAARTGQAMAIGFAVVGLMGMPWLLFIAIFVFLGAEAEAQMTRTRTLIAGIPVGRAMMTRFRVLSPTDTLQTAANELLAGAQQDFPVADEFDLRGILQRSDLVEGLKTAGPETLVEEVMTPVTRVVRDSDMLDATLQYMHESGCSSLPVFRDGQLVGLVTLENVGELMMLQSATDARRFGEEEEMQRAA